MRWSHKIYKVLTPTYKILVCIFFLQLKILNGINRLSKIMITDNPGKLCIKVWYSTPLLVNDLIQNAFIGLTRLGHLESKFSLHMRQVSTESIKLVNHGYSKIFGWKSYRIYHPLKKPIVGGPEQRLDRTGSHVNQIESDRLSNTIQLM